MVRLVALAALCGVLTQAMTMPCGHDCHAAQSASAATSQHACHASAGGDGTNGPVDRLAPAPVPCGHSHEQDSAVITSKRSDSAASTMLAAVVATASASANLFHSTGPLYRPGPEFVTPERASCSPPLRI
jgi:hypothetical protein